MNHTFMELGLLPELTDALKAEGLVQPTPVQERAIPLVLEGKDVIVQAQTGTGKTLAFVLPMLQTMDIKAEHVQALIVTPTRELAIQITSEVHKLRGSVGATALAAYGGQDVVAQIHKLKDAPNIVIGTPGRLLDHLRRGTVSFERLSMLVLDEADQMLHMGFLNEVEEIIDHTPASRQTMLFSATMPDNVRQLASEYMRSPEDVRIQGKRVTLDEIEQIVVETTDRAKQATLLTMLEQYRPFLAVVFCRTKMRAKKLTEALQAAGVNADELHGDLSQAKREQVMKRFREAKLQILVATDVAARGLDVEGVTHVFNYDIPHDTESYIHRIGRTGRAGQSGTAFTFAAPRDQDFLDGIEREIGVTLERRSWDTGESQRTLDSRREASSRGGEARGSERRADSRSEVGSRGGYTRGSEQRLDSRRESGLRGTEARGSERKLDSRREAGLRGGEARGSERKLDSRREAGLRGSDERREAGTGERSGRGAAMAGERSGRGAAMAGERSGRGAASAGERSGRGAAIAGERSGRGAAMASERSGRGAAMAGERSGRGAASAGERSGRGAAMAGERSGRGAAMAGERSGRGASQEWFNNQREANRGEKRNTRNDSGRRGPKR